MGVVSFQKLLKNISAILGEPLRFGIMRFNLMIPSLLNVESLVSSANLVDFIIQTHSASC